jgi:hypothetical protein
MINPFRYSHRSMIRRLQPVLLLILSAATPLHADESLFTLVRSAETLPRGKFDAIHSLTYRSGHESGHYSTWNSYLELEYGATDQLQLAIGLLQHHYDRQSGSGYQFGGAQAVAKYRLLSPFKDPVGLALRLEAGYAGHQTGAGYDEREPFVSPQLILQKNFMDDTLNVSFNLGANFSWDESGGLQAGVTQAFGVAYRFAPNWYAGVEQSYQTGSQDLDVLPGETRSLLVGPVLHYGAKDWWTTLSWSYRVHDKSGEDGSASPHEFHWKLGFNF